MWYFETEAEAILFFFCCSEVNSTWLITSELANQRVQKVVFTCVVYTNSWKLSYRQNYGMHRVEMYTRSAFRDGKRRVESHATSSATNLSPGQYVDLRSMLIAHPFFGRVTVLFRSISMQLRVNPAGWSRRPVVPYHLQLSSVKQSRDDPYGILRACMGLLI